MADRYVLPIFIAMNRVVVRVQRVKFRNLKEALRHRLKGLTDDLERKVEELYARLRKIETDEGRRNLRRNASLVEFVIAFDRRLEGGEIDGELKRFFSAVEEVAKIPAREKSVYFVHEKWGRTHVHVLVVPRRADGKKVNISPGVYKQIVRKYAPHMLPVVMGKRVGVYPLQFIRELEKRHGTEWTKEFVRLCRRHDVKKSQFKAVVVAGKEKELFEELKKLEVVVREAIEQEKRIRRGPSL